MSAGKIRFVTDGGASFEAPVTPRLKRTKRRRHNAYAMTSPCAKCPFRTDVTPYLRRARILEIQKSLVRSEFPCHETTDQEQDPDDDSQYVPTGKEIHCAGALILLEKLGLPSQMMRISGRIGMYDPAKLNMKAPVFDSFLAMAAAQEPLDKGTGEPCSVVDSECEHPAGWDNGVDNTEANAPFMCWSCGNAVCGACSREEKRKRKLVRVCNDCVEQEEEVA